MRPATRPQAGGGHVAHCSALGRVLSRYVPVTVFLESGGEAWRSRFADNGIHVLGDIGNGGFDGIVLDDYDLCANDISFWRARSSGPLVQIEDFGEPLPGIDLVVNATAGLSGDRLKGVPALLGTQYAMLGEPYSSCAAPEIRPAVEKVAVGIGLIDALNATGLVLGAISKALPQARVDVFLGAKSPNAKDIAAMVSTNPLWRLHFDADKPWEITIGADFSVSGGGQSLLERLALGIPTVGISVADNQQPALSGAAKAGAVVDLGALRGLSAETLAEALSALSADRTRRAALSAAAQMLVDGQGAARVADRLIALSRSFRQRATA